MKPVAIFLLALFFSFSVVNAEEASADSLKKEQPVATADTTAKADSAVKADTSAKADSTAKADSSAQDDSGINWKDFLAWPFIHILQPIFNVAVYPVAQPIHYAVDNGVIEKSVDLITFGERRNILLQRP